MTTTQNASEIAARLALHFARTAYLNPNMITMVTEAVNAGIVTISEDGKLNARRAV